MSVLESILSDRRADVEIARKKVRVEKLEALAEKRLHRSLIDRLREDGGTHIIAEMKKTSPSAGLLRKDYRPVEIAGKYQEAGATGVSILTEPHYFMGSDRHVRDVRKAIDLPILRKDFICDPYQVYETAACGADVILLIVAALEPDTLNELHKHARRLGLDVLVEAHTKTELDIALDLKDAIIGVNSRDLKTLKTDLDIARRLARLIPRHRVAIAESGITTREEIVELEKLGYRGFLVGEAIMTAKDPSKKIRRLAGKT